jgi:hypothetical protein
MPKIHMHVMGRQLKDYGYLSDRVKVQENWSSLVLEKNIE